MKHVIIGAGAAGITAAKTIRACDKTAEIVMIAKDEHIHSRCMLHKYLSGERDEHSLSFVEADFLNKYKIIFITPGEVTDIATSEKAVKLAGGVSVSYDKLLIATGADSFIPPIGDFRKAKNVFGLRNLSDAQSIAKMVKPRGKVVIVGSGLVGMDAAYALLEQKMDVTVVEMAEKILPIQLDEAAGKEYQRLFEEAGCKFILGRKAIETVANNENLVSQLILDDNTVLDCDFIIVAAGVRPAIACTAKSSINAESSIEVNEYMETSNPDIYAAGDVTGLSGIWPNAMKQGRTAACNMCGQKTSYDDTYAMKNTINFFGLVTLSLGRGVVKEGDEVLICEDKISYKRAIIRDNQLDSILLQGNINYAGVYQYLIKNKIKMGRKNIFDISFADYYKVQKDGQYEYET
jgi:NAD(P)H-nitrite reductase large subunit